MLAEQWQRNLAAVFVVQTLTATAWTFFFPFIPLYVQTLGVHGDEAAAMWAGVISSAYALSMAVCQPWWGAQADRVGRKPMVVRAVVGTGILTALMGLAGSPLILLVLRLIMGAVTGITPAFNALIASSTPRNRLGFALGLIQVAQFIGTSVGPLGGGLIADSLGYRASFFVAGAFTLLGGAIAAIALREDFRPLPASAARQSAWSQCRSLMGTPAVLIVIIVMFLIQFGGTIVSPVLSLFVVSLREGDNPATTAGIVLAAMGAASAVSALVLGRWSDRVGHGRVLLVCLLGCAVTSIPQALVQQVSQLLLWRVLFGLFVGGLMPSVNALLATTSPSSQRGTAFGLTSTANALANATAPVSGAAIASFLGMRVVFLATGLLYAFGWGCVALGLSRVRTQQEVESELAG